MLKLDDIRKKFDFTINRGMGDIEIGRILRSGDRYILDYDVYLPTKGKNLQRPFCWTLEQKQELIWSILKGISISKITVIQYHEKDYNLDSPLNLKIIDGKQRLSTMISYCKGEFPIIKDGIEYYFKDLDEKAARAIIGYPLTSDIGYEYWDKPISDNDKIAWFELINFAGTPQDVEHLKDLKK